MGHYFLDTQYILLFWGNFWDYIGEFFQLCSLYLYKNHDGVSLQKVQFNGWHLNKRPKRFMEDFRPSWKKSKLSLRSDRRRLWMWFRRQVNTYTVCPRSSGPFYGVTYFIKWVPTSWTYSKYSMSLWVWLKKSYCMSQKYSGPFYRVTYLIKRSLLI